MRNKFRDFMLGRYGMDDLGRFTMYGSLIFLVISVLSGNNWFYLIALVLLAVTYLRTFSRRHSGRRAENDKFLDWKGRLFGLFRGGARQARDRNYCYFKCPYCKQKVRVPKGKGTISIRCPKCHQEFIKRT